MPRKRLSANPQDVLRSLAGLKSDSSVGFLPVILSNPKAQHALYDLRAIALHFLDMEFLTAIRPSHSEPAYMLDAGIDAIGYAAFVQSRFQEYPGIHNNLGALHDYLLNTPTPTSSIMICRRFWSPCARRARPCPHWPPQPLCSSRC